MLSKKTNEACRDFYMCFLVVYMIVREVIPLQFLINNILVSVFVFLVGFLLILWDLFTDKNCLKCKPIDFFAVFIVICVISSIINYRYGIGSNIKCIAAMVLEYFIFFPMGFKENKERTLKKLLNVLTITMFVFVFVSVLMFFFNISYYASSPVRSGVQGFDIDWGRLWGVFGDPNVASYISLVSLFSSVYFMLVYKKVWAYILYGINILFQILFVMLSLSRSGLLIMVFIPIASVFYVFLCNIKTNKKRAFSSILVAITAVAVLYGGYYGLRKSMPYVKVAILDTVGVSGRKNVDSLYESFYKACGVEIINTDDDNIDSNIDKIDPNIKAEIEEIIRKDTKDDYSNGRFERWKAGLEVFKTTPIIGTSPRNAVAIAQERTPDTVMGQNGWVTHCAYLEVLVNSGILGAIVMFSAIIYIAVLFFKAVSKNGFNLEVYISFLCFLTVAAGAFFVSDVFFIFSISTLLFFYLLGYLYGYAKTGDSGILYKIFSSFIRVKSK